MISRLIMIGAVAAIIGAAAAHSHGHHGSKFTVKNTSDVTLKVYSYDGKDNGCGSEHSFNTPRPGKTIKSECHGEKKKRCKVSIKHKGLYLKKCEIVQRGEEIHCRKLGTIYTCKR